jgi:hypothetical protein
MENVDKETEYKFINSKQKPNSVTPSQRNN